MPTLNRKEINQTGSRGLKRKVQILKMPVFFQGGDNGKLGYHEPDWNLAQIVWPPVLAYKNKGKIRTLIAGDLFAYKTLYKNSMLPVSQSRLLAGP